MRKAVFGAVAASCVAVVVTASAQSIAEIARREAARRKAIAKPATVVDNERLRGETAGPQPATPSQPAPAAAPREQTPAPETPAGATPAPASAQLNPEEDPKAAAYWQRRMATTRAALSRAETFAEALQTRINALTTDFVNRDDPAQRAVIAGERDKALAELERVTGEIQAHQKSIAAIQEEGRRAGVPAGWVR
jgi:hypothetical protein